MKLEPSYIDLNSPGNGVSYHGPQGSSGLIIGLCVAGVLLTLFVGLILLLIQRSRNQSSLERHTTLLVKRMPEKPLTLKKPTPAVKSTGQTVAGGVLLKKSPSPTGSKSPPGSASNYASPVDHDKCLPSGGGGGGGGKRRKDSSDSALSHQSHTSTKVTPESEQVTSDSLFYKIFSAGGDSRSKESDVKASATAAAAIAAVKSGEANSSNQRYKDQGNSSSDQGACDSPSRRRMSQDLTEENLEEAKLGKLHFRLKYNYEKHALSVTIEKASDLAVKDGSSHCDPYVKLHLLPDKQHKVKTRVLMKTRNPIYDEEFTFFGIEPAQLQTASLNFVVLSFDRFSRDKVIGEVLLELAHLEFDALEKQMSLVRDISSRDVKLKKDARGELLVSICHQPAANRLTVVVLKARNLPKMDFAGLSDPYVKMYLMADGQRIAKKKTHIKKRTLNPVFNESFIFDLPYQEGDNKLEKISLEFLLLDYERVTKNEVIGKLVLDMNAGGSATRHWKEIAEKPRRQIAEWHKLRYCE